MFTVGTSKNSTIKQQLAKSETDGKSNKKEQSLLFLNSTAASEKPVNFPLANQTAGHNISDIEKDTSEALGNIIQRLIGDCVKGEGSIIKSGLAEQSLNECYKILDPSKVEQFTISLLSNEKILKNVNLLSFLLKKCDNKLGDSARQNLVDALIEKCYNSNSVLTDINLALTLADMHGVQYAFKFQKLIMELFREKEIFKADVLFDSLLSPNAAGVDDSARQNSACDLIQQCFGSNGVLIDIDVAAVLLYRYPNTLNFQMRSQLVIGLAKAYCASPEIVENYEQRPDQEKSLGDKLLEDFQDELNTDQKIKKDFILSIINFNGIPIQKQHELE